MITGTMVAALIALQPQSGKARDPAPTVPAQAWFTTDDYPIAAQLREAEGTASFRVDVDTRGVPTHCTIEDSTDNEALDGATCEIVMARARFYPARDSDGHDIAGSYRSRIRWMLPEPGPADEALAVLVPPYRLEIMVSTGAEGGNICTVTLNGEEMDSGVEPCAFLNGARGFEIQRRLSRDTAVVLAVAIGLDGAPPIAPDAGDRRELIVDATARLTIDPDGRVTDCRVIETNYHSRATIPLIPHLCTFPGLGSDPDFPPSEDNATRFGRLRLELFSVTDGRARTP